MVVFLSNSLYLIFGTIFGIKDVVFIQFLAGTLKVLWNALYVLNIHTFTQYMLKLDRSSLVVIDAISILIILLTNNIIIPVLAQAIVDSHCLYNVFFTPNSVSTSFTVNSVCFAVFYEAAGSFCFYESVNLSTTYIPPFIYSYECSSALLVNYLNVFVYLFLALSFLSPSRILYINFLRHPYLQLIRFFDSSVNHREYVLHISALNYWTILLSCLAMLMTYGVVYPPLALVICLSLVIDTIVVQYLINDELAVLDGDIPNAGNSSILLLLIIIGVFHAWFLFDIAGDKLGGPAASWAPLSSIFLPLALWMFILFVIPPKNSSAPFSHTLSRIHIHIPDA